jgi:phosphonate transport system ATP-binding protein
MLYLDGVTKRYGDVRAVDSVSLTIDSGEMVGIIGRSGAGKSTLLRLMNRLADPTQGEITFAGSEIGRIRGRELRRWRSRCAMIFQQFNLVNRLDVLTNVLIGRLAHRGTLPSLFKHFNRAEKVMALKALHRLDMAPQALQRADSLSGGQQQRVAIAKVLVQEPEMVLADEPIASLDPHNASKVMGALKTINEEDGITVICNLHHLNTAKSYCRRILGMAHGRIVFDGTPEALTLAEIRQIYGTEGEKEDIQSALDFIGDEVGSFFAETAVAST